MQPQRHAVLEHDQLSACILPSILPPEKHQCALLELPRLWEEQGRALLRSNAQS